jgi:hypothetical protein
MVGCPNAPISPYPRSSQNIIMKLGGWSNDEGLQEGSRNARAIRRSKNTFFMVNIGLVEEYLYCHM